MVVYRERKKIHEFQGPFIFLTRIFECILMLWQHCMQNHHINLNARKKGREREYEQESELFDSWDQGRETDSACKHSL